MPVVAGVDSSTQSCKVELRDLDTSRLLGTGSAPHPPAFAPSSEQDPAAWWAAFRQALGAAVAGAEVSRDDIAGISVAAQCHGLVPLDADGAVIRPAKLWNDTTSAPQLERLRAQIGDSAWISTIGSLPTAAFTIGKVAWLAENEPDSFARLARICLPHDWLTLRLSGRHVTDRSDASGTGYWSAIQHRYLDEYLSLIDAKRDWSPMLPEVLGPDEPAGCVSAEASRELGLRSDTIVGAGGGDQHAAALGLAVEPGDVVYSLGTSGVVLANTLDPVFDLSGEVNGVSDCSGGYLPLVCTLNAARVTDWGAGLFGVDHAEFARLALEADPRRSPVLAAYLDGERTPNRPDGSGIMAGITSGTTRAEFARAVHDGVLLGLLRGEAAMNAAGVDTSGRVLLIGGGARSAAYRQILADLAGREVVVADPEDAKEATARGAAVQAAAAVKGVGVAEMRRAWAPKTQVVATPRLGSDGLRDELLARYAIVADWTGFDGQARR